MKLSDEVMCSDQVVGEFRFVWFQCFFPYIIFEVGLQRVKKMWTQDMLKADIEASCVTASRRAKIELRAK